MKDNIKYGNELWTTWGFPERKWDGIKEYKYYGKTEAFLVGIYDNAKLGLCARRMLGVDYYSKLGE